MVQISSLVVFFFFTLRYFLNHSYYYVYIQFFASNFYITLCVHLTNLFIHSHSRLPPTSCHHMQRWPSVDVSLTEILRSKISGSQDIYNYLSVPPSFSQCFLKYRFFNLLYEGQGRSALFETSLRQDVYCQIYEEILYGINIIILCRRISLPSFFKSKAPRL